MADNVVDMLAIEIEANAMQSVDGVKKLSRALTSLAKSVSKVNGAGINNVSASIKVMNTATGTAGQNMTKASKGTKRFGTSLGLLNGSMKRSNSGMKSLAYHFGKFYANCFLAIRGAKAFGSAVESTMDYIEAFNFFDVATNSATSKDWKEYGYDSAEEYATSFKQGLADLNEKMTGFKTDVDIGDITPSSMENLGIDITQLTTFQSEIVSITSSLGLMSKTSFDAASGLSRLTADMSSLHNIDLSTVMTNFQSGLIGQSRALYKYGIDITNATLQTYAYNNGISKSVSEMTQAEKMQLRMLAILDQSKNSWGDLANTINQPANQLRVLKNGFKNLAIIIGKLFMPVVSSILPYLNAMVKSLQYLFTWLAKVAGIDLKADNSGSGVSSAVDDMEDLEDSANDANTAAKKLQNTIYGFDEINKRDSDSSSNTSSGGGAGAGVDLSDAISSALAEYEAAWEAAYANMQDKSTKMANAIVKAFQDGDYEAIGTYVSTGLTNALNGIKWKKIYEVAKNFGSGFASFLNGLITPELFSALGTTIAGAINTAIAASKSFAEKFNFTNLGTSFGAGVNSCLKNINWSDALKSSKAWGEGIGNTLNGFLHETDFALVGSTVANYLNTAITGALALGVKIEWSGVGTSIGNSISGFFKTFDFKDLATTLNTWVDGIFTAIKTAIKTIKWGDVWDGVTDFLSELDVDTVITIAAAFALKYRSTWLKKHFLGFVGGKLAKEFGKAYTAGTGATIGSVVLSLAAVIAVGFTFSTIGKSSLKKDADKLMKDYKGGDFKRYISDTFKQLLNPFEWFDSWMGGAISQDVDLDNPDLKKAVNKWKKSQKDNSKDKSIDVEVNAKENKKSTATLYAGITKTLGKPYLTYIKDNSNVSATTLYDGMQKVLSGKSLVVASKTNTSGWSILQGLQNGILGNRGFGSAPLSTTAKVTTSGNTLRVGVQEQFGQKSLSTSAKVTTSGNTLRVGVQEQFGRKALSTSAKLITSGNTLREGIQAQFGKSNLSTGVNVPNGSNVFKTFSSQWDSAKTNLLADAKINVSATSDTKKVIPGSLTSLLINGYAKGGFPSQGDLFVANENGAELVGGMNGKTTVANQNEIADGFASAIYPSMYSAVKNAMSGSGNNNQPIVVENTIMADTEVLYQKTEQGRKKSERRYGTTVSLA